ncbi:MULTISPECIES: hypothetical protein [Streptacidiphilus]|uniref:Uncharacterized protein n=1 Tax=Streptacidiphilus cavernicola TaxID=3342716 RepID=A0ABV6UVY8_9ACTN|nr:hypothetical protein [Streptacidiphilus jeojiense]
MAAEEPEYGPIGALADFGRDAAPYADRVRLAMEHGPRWLRLTAAITLWSITGRTEPSLQVLEEFVLPIADGGGAFGFIRDALRALIRMGELSPAIRAALMTAQQTDRRLTINRVSPLDGGYPMVLQDQELRGLVEQALACTTPRSGETG